MTLRDEAAEAWKAIALAERMRQGHMTSAAFQWHFDKRPFSGERCRLCGTIGGPIVNRIARNNTPQTSVSCSRCAFVQASPMPTQEALTTYYRDGSYRRDFPPLPIDGIPPDSPGYENAAHNRALSDARFIERLGIRGPILEIGCGEGRVASVLSREHHVIAIESDPEMEAKAYARGVSVCSPMSVASGMFSLRTSFDLVYAMQVLEHQPDPVSTLREWRGYLRTGGRIHLQVPTLERIYGGPSWFFQWPHVVQFTTRTLVASLILGGFRNVEVGINGTVLWATAYRADEVDAAGFPTYADIAGALDGLGPRDDVPALIAAGTPKVAEPSVLERFLAGEDCDEMNGRGEAESIATHDALRSEVAHLVETVMRTRDTLGQMAQDLDGEAQRNGEAFSSDDFTRGYMSGKARQSQALASLLTMVANQMVVRIGTST